MSPTLFFDVLAALHDAVAAALPDVPVRLGPPTDDEPTMLGVFIGWDLTADSGRAGNFGQSYHELGAGAARDDSGQIVGYAVAQSGDADYLTLCSRVSDVLDAIQDVVRADPTLGMPGGCIAPNLPAASLFLSNEGMYAAGFVFRLSYYSLT